jgi:hypothetical protein
MKRIMLSGLIALALVSTAGVASANPARGG